MGRINKIKNIWVFTVIFILFIIVSIWITYPLINNLGNMTTGYGDELLIAWIHSWVMHSLLYNPLSLFNANIYYPYQNSLAFSDIFITSSLITFPFVYLIGQPIVANNISLISSIIFLGFSLYLLSYFLTKNHFVSFLSGILIVFSPTTLSYAIQIQMIEIYWVPLAILFFILYDKTKKTKYFIFFLLSFLFQFYNSFLPAYFIVFSVVIIFIFSYLDNRENSKFYFSSKIIYLILITFLLMAPIVLPYLHVSNEFHYTRDLRDTIHFALQPEDLLYPGANTRLATLLINFIPTNHYSQNNEFKPGYLGIVFSALTIFTIFFVFIKRKKLTKYEKSFLTIAVVGLLLSFGPFMHINRQTIHHPFPVPLPYLVFYYILPGFQGFRNSQRWEMLFVISIAVLISLILSRFFKNSSLKKQIIICGILIIGIVTEFSPFTFVSIPQKKDFPKVYTWMSTMPPNSTFIIFPIYTWSIQPNFGQELYREYFSTNEFRPMVNGYSGFSPQPWQDFIGYLHKNFPEQQSIKRLRSLGVKYIVIDKATYNKEYSINDYRYNGNMIVSELEKNHEVKLIKNIDNYVIFRINGI